MSTTINTATITAAAPATATIVIITIIIVIIITLGLLFSILVSLQQSSSCCQMNGEGKCCWGREEKKPQNKASVSSSLLSATFHIWSVRMNLINRPWGAGGGAWGTSPKHLSFSQCIYPFPSIGPQPPQTQAFQGGRDPWARPDILPNVVPAW